MCCRVCVVCLVLYNLCPLAQITTAATDTDDTPYSELKHSSLVPIIYDDDGSQEVYQIKEGKPEVLDKDYHINRLMEEYGNGTVIMFEGFEHLLHKLGLGKIVVFDHSVNCHKPRSNSSEFKSLHSSHDHSSIVADSVCEDGEELVKSHHHEDLDEDTHVDHDHDHDHVHELEEHELELEFELELDEIELELDSLEHEHEHDHEHNDKLEHDHDNDVAEDTHDHEHDHNDGDTHTHEHADPHQNTNVLDLEESHEAHTDNHKEESDTHRHKHDVDDESDLPIENTPLANNDRVHTASQGQDETSTLKSQSKPDVPSEEKCLPATTLLYLSNDDENLQYLTKDTFRDLCPSLIYQVSHDTCHDHHTHQARPHSNGQVEDHRDNDLSQGQGQGQQISVGEKGLSGVSAKVWGYSTVAVVIISLVGLLGLLVIPIMQKVFYNHMLQFLVALAVGALSGDALLHLLPHAISGGHGGNEDEGDHSEAHSGSVFKGLCGLAGIYSFYLMERVITILTALKRRKKQRKNLKIEGDERLANIGEKLATTDCGKMLMSVHPNNALQGYADEAHSEHCVISLDNSQSISHQHDTGELKSHSLSHEEAEFEDQTNMLSHHNGNAHGHSHSHCHGMDGPPDSIAAVAWMMLLGDGMHKLSDGLAIGAAFSDSITGGFSTSVAMFCHELPHTIGDFAILLRAGMTPKQAIFYNCLSSVLSFFGMLIGVAIGNIENATLWIFAVVGGMFLYIALVDMLPEMSSVETKPGENPFCHLLLQLAGMLLGAGIMLVIALYEHSLKNVFD